MLAVCPGNNQIHIWSTNGSKDQKQWKKIHELVEHDHLVTCIDWAPKSNRILSCSHDRNAYVWDFINDEWKPSLVLLKINRAAVTCKWSPDETKFAVGSGSKTITICFFEESENWWVGKPTKKAKIRSTVLSVAWDPRNSQVIGAASSDFKCRLIGAHLKSKDTEELAPFSKVIQEYSADGWVHDVQFSPSGKYLGFVSHNSTLTVVNNETKEATAIPYSSLPSTRLLFLDDEHIITVGHSYTPELFTRTEDKWEYKGACDFGQYKSGASGDVRAPFAKFQKNASNAPQISTCHENAINGIQIYERDGQNVSSFSTSGVDGRIIIWDAKKCISEAKL